MDEQYVLNAVWLLLIICAKVTKVWQKSREKVTNKIFAIDGYLTKCLKTNKINEG